MDEWRVVINNLQDKPHSSLRRSYDPALLQDACQSIHQTPPNCCTMGVAKRINHNKPSHQLVQDLREGRKLLAGPASDDEERDYLFSGLDGRDLYIMTPSKVGGVPVIEYSQTFRANCEDCPQCLQCLAAYYHPTANPSSSGTEASKSAQFACSISRRNPQFFHSENSNSSIKNHSNRPPCTCPDTRLSVSDNCPSNKEQDCSYATNQSAYDWTCNDVYHQRCGGQSRQGGSENRTESFSVTVGSEPDGTVPIGGMPANNVPQYSLGHYTWCHESVRTRHPSKISSSYCCVRNIHGGGAKSISREYSAASAVDGHASLCRPIHTSTLNRCTNGRCQRTIDLGSHSSSAPDLIQSVNSSKALQHSIGRPKPRPPSKDPPLNFSKESQISIGNSRTHSQFIFTPLANSACPNSNPSSVRHYSNGEADLETFELHGRDRHSAPQEANAPVNDESEIVEAVDSTLWYS